ncbi:hypothetical protein CDV36_015884 [Fusarium kuroshium]|uniref:Uncharacterized protein n=2 Tax=Fusarium solani species complex TaxID=232080 RepID=A0A3M2R600_9HYPO|nr:hypothetical protein CDV36_015884 [Fusarium kuroshium]RSL47349.1 hypothetical protein CEP51_015789 [Fusarium floridanum]
MTYIASAHFLLPRVTSYIITIYSNIVYTVFLVLPSIEVLDHLDSADFKALNDDPQFRQYISDLSEAVASENAGDVDMPRKSTPIPPEDLIHVKDFQQVTTVSGLASKVASSYGARDIYELYKPLIIWRVLARTLGLDGANNLLICVYLGGECSYFNPGYGKGLASTMMSWAAGELYSPGSVPADDVADEMLSFFLGMSTILSRFLIQRFCDKSLPGGTLFNMHKQIGFQPTWEKDNLRYRQAKQRLYRISFLAWIVCQAWDRRDSTICYYRENWFASISDDDAMDICWLLYQLGCCQTMASHDGPVGEMIRIFREGRGQGNRQVSQYGLTPEVTIMAWIKPDMAAKGIFQPFEKWHESATSSNLGSGVDSPGSPVSCECICILLDDDDDDE